MVGEFKEFEVKIKMDAVVEIFAESGFYIGNTQFKCKYIEKIRQDGQKQRWNGNYEHDRIGIGKEINAEICV